MKEHKEKYKKNLKDVEQQTIDELEPIVKKSFANLLKVIQEIFDDFVSEVLNKRRKETECKIKK